MKAGSTSLNLGNIEMRGRYNPSSAQKWYQRSVSWFDRAARVRPNDSHVRLAQANAYAYLADSYYRLGRWQDSHRERMRQFQIVDALHRNDPRNAEFDFRRSAAQRGIAISHYCLGNHGNAGRILREAYRSAEQLRARDPRNAEWQSLEQSLRRDFERMGFEFPSGEPADRSGHRVNMTELCPG